MESEATQDEMSSIQAFHESARDFLKAESPLTRLRALRGTTPGFAKTVWSAMCNAGWASILVPEKHGGLGLSLRYAAAVAQAVGRNPIPEQFVGGIVQPVHLLCALPESQLRDQLLSDVATGGQIIGVAWQERAAQIGHESCKPAPPNPATGSHSMAASDG